MPQRTGRGIAFGRKRRVREWDGVDFGESKQPGVRHLRIGFKTPLAIGSILVRGGGWLSVLRPTAAYPGDLADDAQWMPAERLKGGQISSDEVGHEEFAVWVLPPKTVTCARSDSRTSPRRPKRPITAGSAVRSCSARG